MILTSSRFRPSKSGRVGIGLATLLAGALLALGVPAPAFAATAYNFTVYVTSKSGTPLTGVSVYAYQMANGEEVPDDPAPKATSVAHKSGYYVFSGTHQLLAGPTYTLVFYPTGTAAATTYSQVLGGATYFDRAETFTVGFGEGDITSINASLATNSVIKGTVKGPAGKVLSGATVEAYSYDGTNWNDGSTARTNSHGQYSITDLNPGSYKLEFYAPGDVYPRVFSGGASTMDAATPLSIAPGTTTTANIALPRYTGYVSGVSSSNYEGYGDYALEKALPAAYPVTSEDSTGHAIAIDTDRVVYGARSTSKGNWAVHGLAPGDYVIEMYPWYYNETTEFVNYNSGTMALGQAAVFHVGTGKVSAGWSELYTGAQGGALSLTVHSSSGAVVPSAHVLLQRNNDPDEYYQGTTSTKGVVTFGVSGKNETIRPGDFTLSVVEPGGVAEPYSADYSLAVGLHRVTIALAALTESPGFTTAPTIAETDTDVDTSYTVSAVPARADATLDYQWLRDGHPITGAMSATYQSRTSDIGTQLSVRVRSWSFGFDPVFATADVQGLVTASNVVPLVVSPPTITPADGTTVHPGTVLSVSSGVWSVDGLDFAYSWFEDGAPISDSTDHHLVTADDIGQVFTAQVSATRVGYPDAAPQVTANSVTPTAGGPTTPVVQPAVTSSTKSQPKGATKYTVTSGTWTGLDPEFHYVWRLGDTTVGTDSPTYVELASKTAPLQPLTVEVDATVPGFDAGSSLKVVRKATPKLVASALPFATLTPGGSPAISTTSVAFGQTLTVEGDSVGIWAAPSVLAAHADAVTYTYQWYRQVGTSSVKAISGATKTSYKPVSGDVNAKLSFIETAHSTLWASGVSSRVAVGTVRSTTALVDSPITLSVPSQGVASHELIATETSEWQNAGASVTYQWYVCAPKSCVSTSPLSKFTKIAHATALDYEPPAADAGDRLYLAATATKSGFVTAHAQSSLVTLAAKNVIVLGQPSMTGDYGLTYPVQVGKTETPVWGTMADATNRFDPGTYVFQGCTQDCTTDTAVWQYLKPTASDVVIGGYTPTGADYANGAGYLRVVETVTATGYLPATTASAPEKIGIGTIVAGGGMISLDSVASDYETTTYGISYSSGFPFRPTSIQWYNDGTAVPGNTITLPNTNSGPPVYAVLTFDIPGYSELDYPVVAHYGGAASVTPAPNSIVGTKYGDTLSVAVPQPWTLPEYPGAPWTYSYQWCAGYYCSTSTSPTFTPPASDIGSQVSVNITASSPIGSDLRQTVWASGVLQPGDPLDPGELPQLSWTGSLIAGVPVSVDTPAYSQDDVTTTYSWQTSSDGSTWTTVPGATTNTFTPALTDPGKQLRAQVTGTKTGYPTSVHVSEVEQIQVGDVIQNLSAPAISGTGSVDGALTLDPGTWSHDVTQNIQWLLNGTPIPGATGLSYVPLAEDLGDEISVRVTATRANQLDVAAESNRVTITKAAAPTATILPKISGSGTASSPLVVTTGGWSVGGLEFGYQWSDQNGAIAGATSSSLVLPVGDSKANVSVTVTATRFGYANGTAIAH